MACNDLFGVLNAFLGDYDVAFDVPNGFIYIFDHTVFKASDALVDSQLSNCSMFQTVLLMFLMCLDLFV